MTQDEDRKGKGISRRQSIGALGIGAAAVLAAPAVLAQQAPEPPSTVTTPPRSFEPDAPPNVYFVDPDLVTHDPAFGSLIQANAPIKRLWTGSLWAEGPAWSAVGQYLVWSDIPNNRQLRWLQDDGHVSVMRAPSNNSNGNSFDRQGRQLSCEHLTRRVVRYELDGTVTIIADRFEGKRFNSPNDVKQHRDGTIWFTDPPYGGQLYEGAPDAAGGPSNPDGLINPRVGQPPDIGDAKREMGHGVYRVAEDGTITRVIDEAQLQNPNGLCFSPDFDRLYVSSTGAGPGDTGEGGKGEVFVFDLAEDGAVSSGRVFTDCIVDEIKCSPDGVCVDVYGNVWASSSAGRSVGYNGVTCWAPDGRLLGRIRLPEVCGNLCFGGPKRNVLFMAASQSLYAVPTATQGVSFG